MTLTTKILLGMLALLLAAVGVEAWRLRGAQRAAVAAAMANQNTAARNDTSRAPVLTEDQVARIFGDSLRAQEHLAVQQGITRSDLDIALGRQSQTIAALTAEVKTLRSHSAGTVTGDTGLRVATHHVRSEPYTVDAIDSVPAAPAVPRLALTVAIDPAHLTPRVQCGAPVLGVRPVTVLVTSPAWLRTTVDSAQADPGVCNAAVLHPAPSRRWSLGITAGYGGTAVRDSSRAWRFYTGPSMTVGLTWRPFQ